MSRRLLVCATALALSLSWVLAADITVKRGTVESVSDANQTITVKFAHSESATEVKVSTEAVIRVDDASSKLAAIKPGMSVIVQIGSDNYAERILAHGANDHPTASSATKSPKPKMPTRKSTKTAKTSKSKKKNDKSPFDNDRPVMTTPLAGLKGTPMTTPLAGPKGPPLTTPLAGMKNPDPNTPSSLTPSGLTAGGGLGLGAAGSWPSFLGPNRDNVSTETGLLQHWPADGPTLAWHTQGLGLGFSTVSVSDGIVFSMGTPENQESLLAIGLADGKPLWSVPTGGPNFPEAHGNGPRSTPTIDNGHAYALGASGDLICVDIKSKSVVWRKNLVQEFSAPLLQYGFSESVLIDGPRLICTPGGSGATMVALNKDTGEMIWKCLVPTAPGSAYASPIVAVGGGTRQYINFLSRGVVGVKAADGQFLWGNDAVANANAICSTPLFIKDHVFASASYGAGAALIQLSAADQGGVQANLVYQSREMKNHHGGMVASGAYVYGADDEILTCFSLDNGHAVWKNRSVGKCSLTLADGHLYVRSERGPVALVDATPTGYHEQGRFAPPRNTTAPAWPYPVVAGGCLFLRDQDELLCYSLRATK